jgi:hypothetical protein
MKGRLSASKHAQSRSVSKSTKRTGNNICWPSRSSRFRAFDVSA